MALEGETKYSIQYCSDIILKEARQESKLIKLTLYTMLSAYTKNPINLAINAPSGEGKTHVVQKVAEAFPEGDVIFFAGMTDKALFHRRGVLVIKNESGKYIPIQDKIEEIDLEIEDKDSEIAISQDNNFKQARRHQIERLQKEKKKEVLIEAKKLIDLSNKILIFLDTPSPKLFEALMPLLSHDRYEVEYEFVDTHNGIKTKSNILRGYPAVIFTAAIDYSHNHRYSEIQRRFIIANPKMTAQKYGEAIQLMGAKFGLPNFVYQKKIVSDSEKDRAKSIIQKIQESITEITSQNKPGENNVLIPFYESIDKSLPQDEACHMTIAKRFYTFLSLFPIVNIDKRPRLILRIVGDPIPYIIPLATFEDLKDSMSLMEYNDGVRPYLLEWFHEVFLEAYTSKTEPDKNQDREEKRIAITTEELVDKTYEFKMKKLSPKQILENYLNPLINTNYVVKTDSELDRRANIYYPVISTKNRNLFDSSQTSNSSGQLKITLEDSAKYPDKKYMISKIQDVFNYSSEDYVILKLHDENGRERSVEEIVDQYYNNPDDYFERPIHSLDDNDDNGSRSSDNSHQGQTEFSQNKSFEPGPSDDYSTKPEITNESQAEMPESQKPTSSEDNRSKILFEHEKSNNFLYSCYYCSSYGTNSEKDYERHVVRKHPGKMCYPGKVDLERLAVEGQGSPGRNK